MAPTMLTLVVVLALVMAYVNGFHDASNAVTTAITTRSLRESTALYMAALLNLLGALLGTLLISATAQWALSLMGLQNLAEGTAGAPNLFASVLIAVMLTTIFWELVTWWIGMPSSTWHAFLSATLGASLAIGTVAAWGRLGTILTISLLGPVLSATVAFLLMQVVKSVMRSDRLRIGHLRFAQMISAGAVATGHGIADSRLPLAVIVVGASAAGMGSTATHAMMVAVAIAMGAGTLIGGHRIIRTIGRRLTELTTAQGLAAETSAASTMSLSIFGLDSPVSTSHSLASSVVGAGAAMGPRHVRWSTARTMLSVWVGTPLVCAVICAALLGVMHELSLV
ncbi:inorganic phosphate transporter [Brachybacterium sp. YJGR34]|uniref:inorganic phosphate transporter n=1 Tax=Brachybacterium sp. YJGR34 TaxID=2059911 RepID=UPI000E0B3A15|nr:inorganic phosphate transporter [Brachybacterium sp. YJGR34]